MIIADSSPVKFRMIVFRPFKGEIMLGKIASATENEIKSALPNIPDAFYTDLC